MLLVDDYDRLKNSNPVAICRPFPGSGGQGAVLHIPTPTPAKNRVKISSPKPWAKDVAVQTYNDVVRMCPDGTRNDFSVFSYRDDSINHELPPPSRWYVPEHLWSRRQQLRSIAWIFTKHTGKRTPAVICTALALQCSIASMLAK
jgi:hypothetical protein